MKTFFIVAGIIIGFVFFFGFLIWIDSRPDKFSEYRLEISNVQIETCYKKGGIPKVSVWSNLYLECQF